MFQLWKIDSHLLPWTCDGNNGGEKKEKKGQTLHLYKIVSSSGAQKGCKSMGSQQSYMQSVTLPFKSAESNHHDHRVEVHWAFSQMLQVSWLDSRPEVSTSSDTVVLNCTKSSHIIPVYIIISSFVLPESRSVKFSSISVNCILCATALCKREAETEKSKVFLFLFIQTYVQSFHFPTNPPFSWRSVVFFTSCRFKRLSPRLQPE